MADLYATYSHLINLIGVNALLALSIYLTLSCAMLSLSNAASMGIGAYAAALLTTNLHWPLWPAVAVGALTAGAVGLLLGLPILRLRGVYLAIATIGFGEMVRALIVNTPALGGAEGFRLHRGEYRHFRLLGDLRRSRRGHLLLQQAQRLAHGPGPRRHPRG